MPVRCRSLASALAVVSLLSALAVPPSAAGSDADRAERLARGLEAPGTVRSVFFVRGMTCRACTMLVDRALNGEDGIYWARFNYPLRLFTAYHDPGKVSAAVLGRKIAVGKELEAVLLESGPAGKALSRDGTILARWKGGSLSRGEAEETFRFFEETVRNNMIEPGMDEWEQVRYEIFGEEARNRVLRARAREAGGGPREGAAELPVFISKDFYWPVEHLAPTEEEAAVARFVREKVVRGREDSEGRRLFDDWLLSLWKETGMKFQAEILEVRR